MMPRSGGDPSPPRCHVCGAGDPAPVPGYETLGRVTSDCKPWPAGGRLCVCEVCGCVQKAIDATWRLEAERIYADYTLYYQGGGAEQSVFEAASGVAAPRSARLLQRLQEDFQLAHTGRLLDVGCGNGAFLRAFSDLAPGWRLAATELSARSRHLVEAIPHFDNLYIGPIHSVPGTFDVVSLIHVLEHIPAPGGILEEVCGTLGPGGLLVIQVPDYSQNPFDLLVADHATHFTPETAGELVRSCGYEALALAADWIPKEISVVARGEGRPDARRHPRPRGDLGRATAAVAWLRTVASRARELASRGSFGLFGTSIAAMWLLGILGDQVQFFVDEDPRRVGKILRGRPVHHPSSVPAGSHVLLALPPRLAESVGRRIASPAASFHPPPASIPIAPAS
jgi:SAM-dependent methyltransferase